MQQIIELTKQLSKDISSIKFTFDGYIYNPLEYAQSLHFQYLEKYVLSTAEVLFLGMNPGPYGMMQNGVPFGEVNHVKNWMKIDGKLDFIPELHPNRIVSGLDNKKSEISGLRLWSLMEKRYPIAEDFFKKHCVFNYCPLGFISNTPTAKNITPDALKKEEKNQLEKLCDKYLSDIIEIINPKYLIGVGVYAEEKLQKANKNPSRIVSRIIHPSPGNPQANKDWAGKTTTKLCELGIWK